MKVTNKTRKTIICSEAEIASSSSSRAKGLMFRKSLGRDKGLLMEFPKEGKYGIWMLFMKFPIDIVFIDSEKRVVDIRRNIKPISFNPLTWRTYNPSKKIRYVLETNANEIKRKETRVGDILNF